MPDFVLLAAAWLLDQKVSTYDADGNLLPDDGAYQRRGAQTVYIFGEFMRDNGLLKPDVAVAPTYDFKLRMSDLTEEGQAFALAHLHKWMRSMDRKKPGASLDASGLEKRLKAFRTASA